ncbi:interleukin-1 beta [Amia ocellicauda]|uniref:interleukin-1 beta n=1 Tax=Amia ocellicauda TaxID=2972642 RepID=UPI00346429B1|nr:IL1B protein [Amia calva]
MNSHCLDISSAMSSDSASMSMVEVDSPWAAESCYARDGLCSHKAWHRLGEGLELELSVQHGMHSMRQVATLVIALERMKNVHEKTLSTEFTDDDLFNILMDQMVEECVVLEVFPEKLAQEPVFQQQQTGLVYSLRDQRQKCWILNELPGRAAELLAVTLQGPNASRRVQLNLSTYIPQPIALRQGQPVTLKIDGRNLYLSCSKGNGNPILQVEEVTDKSSLSTLHSSSDMARFLFYKKDGGNSNTTFESAMFPSWYISTAVRDERRPVAMCSEEQSDRIINFMVSAE